MSRAPSRLIIGCGYLGRRVAARWLAAGDPVYALTRGRAEELRGLGVTPVVGDVRELLDVSSLPEVETVLYAVAPDRRAGVLPNDVWAIGLIHLTVVLETWPVRPRLIFVSSTSVYGQTDGSWVDEDAPTEPADESGKALRHAEQSLRSDWWPDAVILRFAGIYGPGRLLRRDSLLAGEPVPGDPEQWLNLIHVEDGAAAVVAAANHGRPGGVCNVSDGTPVSRRAFFTRLAELIGAPPVRFAPSAGGANRRIDNRRLREELGVALAYPSYETGLPASLPHDRHR